MTGTLPVTATQERWMSKSELQSCFPARFTLGLATVSDYDHCSVRRRVLLKMSQAGGDGAVSG